MTAPSELSIIEIRKFMLDNGCRVTNHALVKHFKRFLTQPATQNEARKQFKMYVNILATIKNENNQKFLILRKKYLNECPNEEVIARTMAAGPSDSTPNSPSTLSITSESGTSSPFRQPPPYKPPPDFKEIISGTTVQKENVEIYQDCVNEFTDAIRRIDPARLQRQSSVTEKPLIVITDEEKTTKRPTSVSRENSVDDDSKGEKENIPRFSFSSGTSATSADSASGGEKTTSSSPEADIVDNPISVKEATRKFNRMASEEEAKNIPVPLKKKAEKSTTQDRVETEVTYAHPKAKEWIVAMARTNYQELAKLANDHPELVKLHDPSTGYTALHWAAKQGNEDVVKLIAGTYKADVNARTNGGYTALHLAMQFRREEIFELLCNVYKANRDLMDWSGNKPLDYSKQHTSVSPSTYSSEYSYYSALAHSDPNYKYHNDYKYSNFYNTYIYKNNNNTSNYYNKYDTQRTGYRSRGSGGTLDAAFTRGKKRSQLRYATISSASGPSPVVRNQSLISSSMRRQKKSMPPLPFPFTDESPMFKDESQAQLTDNGKINYNNNINKDMPISPGKSNIDASEDIKLRRIKDDEMQERSVRGESKARSTRRKESFLRKALRATTAPNKNNHDVTNETLPE